MLALRSLILCDDFAACFPPPFCLVFAQDIPTNDTDDFCPDDSLKSNLNRFKVPIMQSVGPPGHRTLASRSAPLAQKTAYFYPSHATLQVDGSTP